MISRGRVESYAAVSPACFSSVTPQKVLMNSAGSSWWHGLSYTRVLPLIPRPFPYITNTEFPGSYFNIQVMKAATWWETNQHVPHKRLNLCQLKSVQGEADQGGGGCVLVCVCVFIPMTTWMKTCTSLHSEPI